MKKTLRTLLAIMLAVVLLVGLTGCGDKEEKDDKKDSSKNEVSSTSKVNDEDNNQATIEKGEWQNDVYTNDFLKYNFKLPTGWKASTDEEIAQLMKIGEDVLEDEGKYISEASKLSALYFAVAKASNGSNIIIMAEKPSGVTEVSQYIRVLKNQLESLTTMEYKTVDEGTAKLGDANCTTLELEEGTTGVEQKYYVYKEGDYLVSVIMTSTEGSSLFDELEENFENK